MLLCRSVIVVMGMLTCRSAATAVLVHGVTGPTEADWIRWTGVVVGVVGAIVVAPAGALVILGDFVSAARRAWKVALRVAARWLPWLRRDVNIHGVTATAHLSAGGSMVATGDVSVSGGSLEDQINQLREEIRRVRDEVREARREAQDNHAELSARLDRDLDQLRSDHRALTEEWKAERRRDAQIDARGLPLIGIGILLAGVPDGLAKVGWIGWAVMVISGLLVLWLAVVPFGSWLVPKLGRALTPRRSAEAVEGDGAAVAG